MLGNIEQIFHQVKVWAIDTNALRFLWNKSPDETIIDCEMTTDLPGKTDSSCCLKFTLKINVLDRADILDPSVVTSVVKDFYMDDFIKSDPSIGYYEFCSFMCNHSKKKRKDFLWLIYFWYLSVSHGYGLIDAGFHLTKFTSNEQAITQNTKDSYNKLLGLLWNIQTDLLTLKSINKFYSNTKRGILSLIFSIFDALAILAQLILLEAKLTVQDLWHQNIAWD